MTRNEPTVVEPEAFTVRRTIEIAAAPIEVWPLVSEPEQISRWFGRTVIAGGHPGAEGTITWPGEPARPIRIEAVERPRSISYRWCNDEIGDVPESVDDGPSTVFTFTLEATKSGTRLTVEETGFDASSDPAASMDSHRQGWDSELDTLVRLVGTGAS